MDNNLIEIPAFLNNESFDAIQITSTCQASEYARACSTNAECGQCDSCERSGQSCGISEESCGGYGCMGGCQACENSCQTTCQKNSQGCSSCQRTCQTTCEENCQDFCENTNQNFGIYSSNNSQITKMNNVYIGKSNKKAPILQAYAGINNEAKIVYDAINNITGIAVVANGIFNTDNSGVKNVTTIEKYQWYGELEWESTYNRLTLYNNIASSGAGLEGKIYFKLKDGTYIDNEEIIKMLFTSHEFTLEVYNDVSSSSRGSNTLFGRVFADNETFIFTKDTMLNLNFSLSIWYSASYESNFRIKTATIDGRDLSVEFFDKTKELPYYADINNVAEAIIKINNADLWGNLIKEDDGTYTLDDHQSSGITAYSTWINTYGTVVVSNGSSYSTLKVSHTAGSATNKYMLEVSGYLYLRYKDGVEIMIDNAPLPEYFKGSIKMKYSDSGGSSYWCYIGSFATEIYYQGTKTFTYPDDFSDSYFSVGVGRYSGSNTVSNTATFYNPTLNNIGLLGVSIPTRFEIDPSWL